MRVTIDLMKKSTQIIDLSNVINPRVGDDDLSLPLHIVYDDNQTDMRGKDVEFLSNDTNKKRIYVAGTCNTNTPGDNLLMGNLTFRFPAGTFKADGTYDPDKTMFRIVDKETQKVISSVNVKITVMKNNIEFDFDPDKSSYDSRAETMLQDFHDKGQAMLDEIKDLNNQAKSNVSGDTATTAKEAKKQADQNAGDISDIQGEVAGARGRFADMAGREDAQDAAINQKESIVNANTNYAALKQKDAQQDAILSQKAGKFELEDKLSQMRLNPQGFANLADLKAKYPNGNPSLNITVDDGHLYIWYNGEWKDCGQYQTAGLEQSVIDMIHYAFFDGNLIPDGRFTNQDRSVWPVTSDTQFTTITYFGQQWLQITATGNQANRGVGWNVAKLTDDLFDNQAIINFKIRSSISERLSLNLQYARSDGSVIATQSISDVNLSAYTLIDFKRTISFNRSLASDTATVKLMLTKDDTSDLGTIMITDVSMKLIGVPDSATKDGNLISSGEQDNGLPSSWKYTSDTVLGVSHYLNRDWIQVTANGNSQYRGVGWTLKNNQYNDVLTYLLRIKMDVWSSIAQQLALNVAYVDKQGNTIATDSISDVTLAITSITQVDRYFKLQAPDPSNVDHVNLNLVTNGTADIGTILVSNVSVTIADKQSDNGNLVATSANGVAQGWGFTSNTILQPVFRLGKYWLQITADGNNKYRGASWAITKDPAGEVFNYPLKVEFNIESSVTQDLALNVQLAKADGTLLQTDSIAGVELTAGRIQHQTYLVNLNYANPAEVSQINLELLTNGTADIGTILVSDLSVTPVYDKELDKKDSNDLQDSRAGLPVMNLKGSLNGISGDKYVPLQFAFTDGSRTVSGYASTKWQGQSSMSMPKKAYRIKTFSDDKLSKKLKFKPCAEWEADSKWNLKAYYTDPLIGRDATNAKIGGAIWSTEQSLPQQLVETNNFGFVDGFPILLYINGSFAGVYSFNIAKGDYGKNATVISGTAYSDTTQYKSVPADGVKLDGSDFEMISPDTATDDIKKSVNDLLTFIATSSDIDFKAHFDEHLDKTSVIDYLIFSNLIDNSDAWGKNQTLITYDGKLWYFHPYDLDVSFGGEWDGSIRNLPTTVTAGGNHLFDRVSSLFSDEIKARYTSLRSWLTPAYVINQYHNLVSSVGEDNYEQEYALWNNPNFEQNDFNFVKSRIITQFKLCDKAWLN